VKVAVLGAGALGGVYGVLLAARGGVDVTFVVRPARASSKDPITIERVRKNRRDTLDAPVRSSIVPPDTDVILLAVGTEDLDALKGPIGNVAAPLVILTPMLPRDWARVREAFGDRAHAAMPSVVAYTRHEDGVIRYWLPPAPTKIDEPRPGSPSTDAVRELANALSKAGLRARLELGVHETNPATTVCFISIGMALSIAGSAQALTEDETLLSLTARACHEGVRLSHRIGTPEPWGSLTPVLAAPWAFRAWLGALPRVSPEALFYAEEHFGRKLKAQHRVMIQEMIDLAHEKGLPHDAFDELARRLAASA
jgi:Ketopantoate reductase PanE/ApbA